MNTTRFKPGDQAIWWTGPGGQSRFDVTLIEWDAVYGEWLVEMPSWNRLPYENVDENELYPAAKGG